MKDKSNRYHIILLLPSNVSEDKRSYYIEEFKRIFKAFGLEVIEQKGTPVTHFAYPIKKCLDGFYHIFVVQFKIPSTKLKQKIFSNVRTLVSKACEGNALRYVCFSDESFMSAAVTE